MAQYTKLQESEIHKLLRKYELEAIGFSGVAEGAGNSNYLIETNHKKYMLTVFEIGHRRVLRLCKLLRLLKAHRFPTNRIQTLSNGAETTSFQGKPVMLKPYLAGQVVAHLNKNMLRQVGGTIAKLHMIPVPDYLPDQHAYGLQSFSRIMGQDINPEYENWLSQKHSELSNDLPSGLPRGLIHGDVFYDNVLFAGDTFKALIDFEEACRYYQIFDLGMAVVGLCVKNAHIRLSQVRSLVAGYQEIRQLWQQEKQALQLFVEYAAVATSSWRFWKYNIDTPLAKKADKHCEMVTIAKEANTIPPLHFMQRVFQ